MKPKPIVAAWPKVICFTCNCERRVGRAVCCCLRVQGKCMCVCLDRLSLDWTLSLASFPCSARSVE
eukprot:7482210-Alexandrium_andersonii.AAC.1